MSKLIKDAITTYIPASPGSPGSPYVPAQPGYYSIEEVTECTGGWLNDALVPNADGSVTFVSGALGQPVCTTREILIYHPPVAAKPGVPYVPPTPEQFAVSLNQGWNSYARTVGSLDLGTFLKYTVKDGSHGALMAVGVAGMEGQPLNAFPYGIMVDTGGIYLFEYGQSVQALPFGNSPAVEFRIGRLPDGRIGYSAGSFGAISGESAYGQFEALYVYGMLYSGGDEISTSAFVGSTLITDAALAYMDGAGDFAAAAQVLAYMDGAGDFVASIAPAVVMDGAGWFEATLSTDVSIINTDVFMDGAGALVASVEGGGRGSVTLLAVQAFGGDGDAGGMGSTMLPYFTATGAEALFVPAKPTTGYINLPFVTAWGFGTTESIGNGDTSLPLFVTQGSEGDYGIGDTSLPLFLASGYGGFQADDEMVLFSSARAETTHAAQIDLVLFLNSSGELASSLTLTRAQALELLSELGQSDSFSMLGVYGYTLLSGLRGMTLQTLSVGGMPDLHDGGVVWVVNADTKASSQYEGYGFNSFFTRDGVCYGVAADGIYRLEGASDAGQQVDALAYIGALDLASALKKLLPNAYIAASSTGPMRLEVDADGAVYLYEARSYEDGTFKQHRFDLGRGLKANMLGLTLKNKDGADFKVSSVDLLTTAGGRRI